MIARPDLHAVQDAKIASRSESAHFSRRLQSLLQSSFNAELAGSWAHREGHLPHTCHARVVSFSDVDVLLDHFPQNSESKLIINSVMRLANVCGVGISKVSVRNRSEMEQMWDLSHVDGTIRSRTDIGRFLMFWIYMGAAEAVGTEGSFDDSTLRAYGLTKFFFKFFRNVLPDCGRLAPYGRLATMIYSKACNHHAVINAYSVKVGAAPLFQKNDEEILLSEALWLRSSEGVGTLSTKDLAITLCEMREWYKSGVGASETYYLDQALRLVDRPEMAQAVSKARHDYRIRKRSHEE